MLFREKYLSFAELNDTLSALATSAPTVTQLTTLGKSSEGRDIPLLIVGREPASVRPAVWVDGNMHASEFCGSNVALAIADDLLALHRGEQPHGISEAMAEAIRETHFYIVPRISPDGAESVLNTGRYVRSSPADTRPNKAHAHWRNADVDGDGQMGYMRQACTNGEMVALPEFPDVLVPRELGDQGPFYKLYPEGVIENFDGHHIPDPYFLSDNETDFNRNFPYQWGAEDEQRGAGQYPGSTPETRAILEFVRTHPNIFVWVNFHTFGGVFLRPFGDRPDHEMDPADLAAYKQIEVWAREHTGYPMVSGYHEFQYEPGTPVRGILTDYAYHQRGALAYGVELWDVFTQIGMPPTKRFIDKYTEMTRADYVALARWDKEHNSGRIFRPWRRVEHPQLGSVEVGGIDLRVGISNPPFERLAEVCDQQSAAFLRVAAMLPLLSIELVNTKVLTDKTTQIDVRVRNAGYLGTHGVSSARKLPHVEPLRAQVRTTNGLRVLAPSTPLIDLGHLQGWGRGPFGGTSIFAPWTRGSVGDAVISLVVAGEGELSIEVSSCRIGSVTRTFRVPSA